MDKRYQVFVSSTFIDLQQERNEVMQALLELNCIPAGMELFPAADETQWELIQRVIAQCDYYVVVIAGRYGSCDSFGVSYTEKEYDFAVESGIPALGFLHGDPGTIPSKFTESDPITRSKLEAFVTKVKLKHCKFWKDAADLGSKVSRSLVQQIQTRPGIGWVRANQIGDPKTELALRERIDELARQLEATERVSEIDTSDLCQGSDKILIHYTYVHSDQGLMEFPKQYTWNELFALVFPVMTSPASDQEIKAVMISDIDDSKRNSYESNFDIEWKYVGIVKTQSLALGLTVIPESGQGIKLSQKGFQFLTQSLALRRKKEI